MTLPEQLTALAKALNASLEANGREERWERVGCESWACGRPVASVRFHTTRATIMQDHTHTLIAQPRDHGLRGDVTIEDVTARLNAELAAARDANAALRGALRELLAITEDPELDTGEHCGLERLEQAQAAARAALGESVGL